MMTLARWLTAKGLRVELVLARMEGPFVETAAGADLRMVDLRAGRMVTWPLSIARYLRESRPPILLSALPHANVAAAVAGNLACTTTRIVLTEHTTVSSIASTSRRPLAHVLPLVMRIAYPRADCVVAVSEGVAEDLRRQTGLPRSRIEVIHNPIDLAEINAASGDTPPHPWLATGEPPVILTAGRMIPAKDHHGLLEAFALLRASRPCRLVILGDGPLREGLAGQVVARGLAEDVLMPGFVSNPFPWMNHASVLVLSSRREGLPTALIEAMACGTPVVSTDCRSGPAEILEDGKWGRLVPVGDPAALAAAIAATLDDPNPPDVRRRAADFGVDTAIASYLRVMDLAP